MDTNLRLQLFYQSQLLDGVAEQWMLEDFEDLLFIYSVWKLAPEFRKPEVLSIYTPLWQDERESLAIYTNELEWAGVNMMMGEAMAWRDDRYPAR